MAQAKRSSELFTGQTIPDSEIDRIEAVLSGQMKNIVLVGMPSSGKSTLAAALGETLGRSVYEADALIAQEAGMDIPAIFAQYGEEHFRALETEILSRLGKLSGAVSPGRRTMTCCIKTAALSGFSAALISWIRPAAPSL